MRAPRFSWHGLSFCEVRDLDAVEMHDCARSINCYVHRVPFAKRFDRSRQCFCKCVKHAGARIVVGPVANFDLITSVDWHPRLGRLVRYANKDPGVGFLRGEFEDNANGGMLNLFSSVPKHAHSTLGLHHSILHDQRAWTDLLPAIEILPIKQSTPGLLSSQGIASCNDEQTDGHCVELRFAGIVG